MSVVRWDPFRDFLAMHNEFDNLCSRDWAPVRKSVAASPDWVPPVNVRETEKQFLFSFEVPGVKKEDITLEIIDDTLTVRGERHQEDEQKKEGALRIERRYGKFTRSFTLPVNVNASEAKASYKDGVLEIALPKAEAPKAKQIEIAA